MAEQDIAGYLRVSTAMQGVSGLSLDSQRTRITGLVAARGLETRRLGFHQDIASAVSARRPALERLLDLVADGEIRVLVVTSLDRLVRDTADYVRIAEVLERRACQLASCDGTIDLTHPMGRFGATLMAAVAQLERELIASRTREAVAELKRQGRPVGNAPYGWCVQRDGDRKVLVKDSMRSTP